MADVGIGELASSASLLLLVGGLAMLGFTMTLVLVQNLFPDRLPKPGLASAPTGRTLRPLQGGAPAEPRAEGDAPGVPQDLAMVRILQRGLGEPRLLRAHERFSTVRLYGCACAKEPAACELELRGIEEAFRAVYGGRAAAREVRCLRRGHEACDFEVKH